MSNCHIFAAIMTVSKKSLFERNCKKALRNLSKLPTWKKVAFGFMFFLLFVLTIGGSGVVTLAVLMGLPDGMMLSGRSNGTVFQRNGIRRNFAMSANPQTSFQTNIRNFFGGLSSMWRGLSPAEQTSWRSLTMEITNRIGQKRFISGKEVFVRLNTWLALIGLGENTTAPTLVGQIAPEHFGSSGSIDVSDSKFNLDLSNDDAAFGIVVLASLPLLPGRTTSRVAFVYGNDDSTDVNQAADIWTGYVAKWGYTPVANDNIIVKCYYVNKTTGEASPYASYGAITVQA